MRMNYIIVSLTFLGALGHLMLAKLCASYGMAWYDTLCLPYGTPPAWLFRVAWPLWYTLMSIVFVSFWHSFARNQTFYLCFSLFFVHALLSIGWMYVFFVQQTIGLALIVAVLLCLTLIGLLYYLWPWSRFMTLLLVPYALWLMYALYLNVGVWLLN